MAPTFLSNIAWGRNDLDKVKSRNGAATSPVLDNSWAFADFPIAYDQAVSSKQDSRLLFTIWGIQEYQIEIDGLESMNQVFGENQPGNISDVGFFLSGGTFQALGKNVSGTQETWTKWINTIKTIGTTIPSGSSSSSLNNLKDWVNNVQNSWTVSSLGLVGAGVGFIDFLITGGRLTNKEQPAPINYALNFHLTGTMRTDDQVGAVTLPLPGATHTPPPTYATNLLYTQPLGTLNLAQTPVLQHRTYWWPQGGGLSIETHSYRVKEDLIFDLNPSSDLEISKIEAAFVFEFTASPQLNQQFLGYADQGYSPIDGRAIELESYNNEKYVFRTPYTDAYAFKNQSITLPSGFSLFIKIKAELKVKNSPSSRQPVIFIATYDANVEQSSGNQPWPFTVSNLFTTGWKQVSVPLVVSDYSRYSVFPTVPPSSSITKYVPGAGYVTVTTLANGPGYWAKFPSTAPVTITGTPISNLEIPVAAGWNFIGTNSYPVQVPNICSSPTGIITGSIFTTGPTSGYIYLSDADRLLPGYGYWINITTPGTIILEAGPSPCGLEQMNSSTEIDFTLMDKFTITDVDGKSQELFVSNVDIYEEMENMDLELPPFFEDMDFDARFEFNEFVKKVSSDSGTVDLNILVNSNQFPITLSWDLNLANGLEYAFISDSGLGKISAVEVSHGNVTFNSLNNNRIQLLASTSKMQSGETFPNIYSLYQNFPNPFNPVTTIKYGIQKEGEVKIVVYDILGRTVKELVNEKKQPGRYEVQFDANNLASGVYLYRLSANEFIQTKKMILMK